MNWSEQAWNTIEPIYGSIQQMSFIEELANGSLEKEKFQFYMSQDSLYLEHFGRTLALISARIYDINDVLSYIRFAENSIVVENALHESYFKDFDVIEKGNIEPACHHYIHFLRSTAALEPVEVAIAATLPCFWIYKKIGDYIYQNQIFEDNPYHRWIETYGGHEFATAVQNAITIADKVAEKATPEVKKRMTEAFITASRMEYIFWDAAYQMTRWDQL